MDQNIYENLINICKGNNIKESFAIIDKAINSYNPEKTVVTVKNYAAN